MRTNIEIDDRLMDEAKKATGISTKKETVEAGLKLLIQVHGQTAVRRLRGKIAWEGDLDELRASRFL
jgi:Arc/MetJ family transcription regulator